MSAPPPPQCLRGCAAYVAVGNRECELYKEVLRSIP